MATKETTTVYHAEVESDERLEELYTRYQAQIEAAQGKITLGRGFRNSPSILMVELPASPKVDPKSLMPGENIQFKVVHGQKVQVPQVEEAPVLDGESE